MRQAARDRLYEAATAWDQDQAAAAVVALRSYLANIPRVTVRGLEADGQWQVAPWFALRGALMLRPGNLSGPSETAKPQ